MEEFKILKNYLFREYLDAEEHSLRRNIYFELYNKSSSSYYETLTLSKLYNLRDDIDTYFQGALTVSVHAFNLSILSIIDIKHDVIREVEKVIKAYENQK